MSTNWFLLQRKSPGHLSPWLAKLLSKDTEELELSDQIGDPVEDDNESDLESRLSDEDGPTEESSTKPVDEPSSESPPPTSGCYSLRSRAGGVQPPNRYNYVTIGTIFQKEGSDVI